MSVHDLKKHSGNGHWINAAIKHPGELHMELGIAQGQKIPAKKMQIAESGADGPAVQRRAKFAKELEGFHK